MFILSYFLIFYFHCFHGNSFKRTRFSNELTSVNCCLKNGLGVEGGSKKAALLKICHTYPIMMKLGTVTPFLKKIQKKYESCDTPHEFCWHQHCFKGSRQILLYQEIQIESAFWCIISNSFNFCWVFKDSFNKHGYNFDDVSSNGYSRPS